MVKKFHRGDLGTGNTFSALHNIPTPQSLIAATGRTVHPRLSRPRLRLRSHTVHKFYQHSRLSFFHSFHELMVAYVTTYKSYAACQLADWLRVVATGYRPYASMHALDSCDLVPHKSCI